PNGENENTRGHGLPTESPAHFRNYRSQAQDEPRANNRFGQVEPVTSRFAEPILTKRQQQKNYERHNAGQERRAGKLLGQWIHAGRIINELRQRPRYCGSVTVSSFLPVVYFTGDDAKERVRVGLFNFSELTRQFRRAHSQLGREMGPLVKQLATRLG